MLGRALLVALILGAPALALAEQAPPKLAPPQPSTGCKRTALETGDRLERRIEIEGVSRGYILDAPVKLKAGSPVPLLLDFHGFGHSGAGVWRVSQFRPLAARDGFITVYPEGLQVHLLGRDGAGWEIFELAGNRDLAFVTGLLDHLEREYCVDRARVYATGFSNGGYLSHLLACSMSDRIAAIAPVGGGLPQLPCEARRGVPVLIHHGSLDRIVPVSSARAARDMWLQQNKCAVPAETHDSCQRYDDCQTHAAVEYCEGEYDHTWPADATERIWTFLSAQSLPTAVAENK